MSNQPNILFILADDQRFDTLGALGHSVLQTPHLDALARRGTAFTHAHIPGGTSGAVCMPSRAMLMTGRTLFHLEREGQQIPGEHTTLPEHLRAAGYQTYGIGKWHNGRPSFTRSFGGGDEIFFGGMWDHWNVPTYRYDPSGAYAGRLPLIENFCHTNRIISREGDRVAAGVHSSELFTDAALRFLAARRPDDPPFCLYVAHLAPHDPRTMPERFRAMYDPAAIELPANFAEEHPIDTGALRVRDEVLAAAPRDPAEIRRHIAEYYAMISHLDEQVGRLLAGLAASGLADDTLVVYAGDNGLAVGQHGLMGKQNLYEHSVRVPLLLAGPGVPQGQQTAAAAYLLDIFPTLCELTGTPAPDSVEGRSLVPCLHGAPGREWLYLAYCDTIRGVKNDRWKLLEYAAGGQRATQVFDLRADPLETRNLADDPALVADLRRALLRLRNEWDDPGHPLGRQFWSAIEFAPTPA